MRREVASLKAQLDPLFRSHEPREAHALAKSIFKNHKNNRKLLEDIILQNAETPGFFAQNRINPVVMLRIIDTPVYNLIGHAWIPLPHGNIDQTHQSIHHHGNLLLTSLAAYGPGYESILFKFGYVVNPETLEANLRADKFYRNPHGNVEFVDSHTPHVVLYPEQLSVTYALWSPESRPTATALKRQPILRKIRGPLKKLATDLGLKNLLGLNDTENFDFFVEKGKVLQLPKRIMYQPGSNDNFIRAFFYVLQNLDFSRNDDLKRIIQKTPDAEKILPFFDSYWQQNPIDNIFEPHHLGISKVNLPRQDLLACFPELPQKGELPK